MDKSTYIQIFDQQVLAGEHHALVAQGFAVNVAVYVEMPLLVAITVVGVALVELSRAQNDCVAGSNDHVGFVLIRAITGSSLQRRATVASLSSRRRLQAYL